AVWQTPTMWPVQYEAVPFTVQADNAAMCIRLRFTSGLYALALIFGSAACGPYLPPTIVPAARTPALEAFRATLKTYVDQTQPFRKDAAAKAASGTEEGIR